MMVEFKVVKSEYLTVYHTFVQNVTQLVMLNLIDWSTSLSKVYKIYNNIRHLCNLKTIYLMYSHHDMFRPK
jgi:hypothetical protein